MGCDKNIFFYTIFISGVIILMNINSGVLSNPVGTPKQVCPVITDSDLEPGVPLGSKVIKMEEVEGQKVKLQFYYPSVNRRREADSSAETTTLVQGATNEDFNLNEQQQQDEIATTEIAAASEFDIFCQWDFRAGNDSQFLLLTFEKLSAPYSENCAEAFVAMQKENGYESRWCGNRRQANARPMALFSRGSAKISIYRNANAPHFPSTGFTVVVQSVDVNMLNGGKNALRVLLG